MRLVRATVGDVMAQSAVATLATGGNAI